MKILMGTYMGIQENIISSKAKTIMSKRKEKCPLTLSASQTLTVLSNEDVARRDMLGLKRTSVIKLECSSSVDFGFKVSVYHIKACVAKKIKNKKRKMKMISLLTVTRK